MKKTFKKIIIGLAIAALSSCASSKYDQYYELKLRNGHYKICSKCN